MIARTCLPPNVRYQPRPKAVGWMPELECFAPSLGNHHTDDSDKQARRRYECYRLH